MGSKKSTEDPIKAFILKLPASLHNKLKMLAVQENETLNNLLLKAGEAYLKEKAPWIEAVSFKRTPRIGKEDAPILLEAITRGTGDKLYRTKGGKLRLRGEAGKGQRKNKLQRS